MAGRNCADIVFCIDASGSMKPAIDAVRDNITKLLEGLTSGGGQNYSWDVRFDFLAFRDSKDNVHRYESTYMGTMDIIEALYGNGDKSKLFTTDVKKFQNALSRVKVDGEEMQLLALDTAMDYPWRPSGSCHRVVVLLSDEAVETGVFVKFQTDKIADLTRKAMDKRIKLFIIAPESQAFYDLAVADRCEYTDIETNGGDGLREINFSKMLETIGKSVSISQTYDGGSTTPAATYDQHQWKRCSVTNMGSDT